MHDFRNKKKNKSEQIGTDQNKSEHASFDRTKLILHNQIMQCEIDEQELIHTT